MMLCPLALCVSAAHGPRVCVFSRVLCVLAHISGVYENLVISVANIEVCVDNAYVRLVCAML